MALKSRFYHLLDCYGVVLLLWFPGAVFLTCVLVYGATERAISELLKMPVFVIAIILTMATIWVLFTLDAIMYILFDYSILLFKNK